jgi:hypothetical protein
MIHAYALQMKTSFLAPNRYNIGNVIFGFFVNLDNIHTDITHKIQENCTWLDRNDQEDDWSSMDRLSFLAPPGYTKGDI